MKKGALVVGARPQFIKIAPLIIELERKSSLLLVHTGQHYDFMMSGEFFEELDLPKPDYHLNSGAGSHGRQTGRMIERLESVLAFEKPSVCIVVGDTNSTLAGALAAAKLKIPVVHVEAGVRSKDISLPEQINRVVTDSVSHCLLCPTPSAIENLAVEGKRKNVYDTGDLIYDCLRMFENEIPNESRLAGDIPDEFILTTLHRAEAVDDKRNLTALLRSLGSAPCKVVFPMHPRTAKMIARHTLHKSIPDCLQLIEPIGYRHLLSLIKSCRFVITDSGGVQREAAFLGKQVFVARPETEWRELEKSGWVRVVGYDFDLTDCCHSADSRGADISLLTRPAAKSMAEIITGFC